MIYVKTKTTKDGTRVEVRNQNGNIFNHIYNTPAGAKKMWESFVKQIIEGKIKFIK